MPGSDLIFYAFLIGFSDPAGPPSKPNIDSVSLNTIEIFWEKTADDGGGEINGYVVEVKPKDGNWSEAFPFEVKETECTVLNLKEGQEYQFNAAGPGEPSLLTNPVVAEGMAEKPSLDLRRLKDMEVAQKIRLPVSIKETVNVTVLDRPSPPQGPLKALETSPTAIAMQWKPPKELLVTSESDKAKYPFGEIFVHSCLLVPKNGQTQKILQLF